MFRRLKVITVILAINSKGPELSRGLEENSQGLELP